MLSVIKRLILTVVLLLFVSVSQAAAAGAGRPPQPGTNEYNNQVVLRVNGVEFTMSTYQSYVNTAIPQMSMHKSVGDERKEEIKDNIIREMITGELVAEEAAKDEEIVSTVKKKEVEDAIDALTKKLPKGVTLKQMLKNSKMSKDDLRTVIRKDLQARRFNVKMSKKMVEQADNIVDDAYAKDYYEKNLAKFREPEQVRMRMILIKADPSGGTKVWAEAYKTAKELAEKARAGEDFGKLAKERSEDKDTAEKEGDMGWLHRGSMMEEIEAVSEKMKPGDVSEPINTLYGYLVVKLEEIKPEVQRKFEEVKLDKLKAELSDKLAKSLYDEWLDGLWAAAKIEFLTEEVRLK